ncbi:MAG: hypothetical protein COB53_07700 [Elusimicrobia bacterium]|nr:MAG: hypothetical protein COB53_07700 [Elusimicrobiota bacterium]
MLYHVRLKDEPTGPWPLRDIVMMSGVTPETLVCPEFDLGSWRPLDAVIGTRSDTAFLFQIRMRAEQLLTSNQKLRWALQQQLKDHEKVVEREKARTAEAELELEQRKQQLDEVLDHNLELDTTVDDDKDRVEKAEKRVEEGRRDLERLDAERKAFKHRGDVLERELEEIKRLSGNVELTQTQMEALKADLDDARRELVRSRSMKEAHDRQREEMRTELEKAHRAQIELEARLRTQVFEAETFKNERGKEVELLKLKSERSSVSLEEKRKAAEELRMRIEAVEARAIEAEARLRSVSSSSTVETESLKSERETLANELDKQKLIAIERAKTIEDLRNQLETLRDRANEAENRLRVAATKSSGNEANLREEKESLSRQAEVEKGRRAKAEEETAHLEEEIKIFQTKEESESGRHADIVDELNVEIRSLKQDLARRAHQLEQLETRLQDSTQGIQAPVPVGAPAEEERDPDETQPISVSSPEPEPEQESEELPEPIEDLGPLSPDAPTVEVGPGANPEFTPEKPIRKIPWKLAAAAGFIILLIGSGAAWFFLLRKPAPKPTPKAPVAEEVLELSPDAQKRFYRTLETVGPVTAPKAKAKRVPTVLRPVKKKPRKKRKRLKRVQKKPRPKPIKEEMMGLPGYSGD